MANNLSKLIAILILLVVVLLVKIAQNRINPPIPPYAQVVKDINPATLSSIKLAKNDESVVLNHDGQVWKVEGKRVNSGKVDQLIKGITSYDGTQLVAQTDTRHKELGVVSGVGIDVAVDDHKFIAGGSSFSGIYIRADGKSEVYLLPALTNISLSTSPSFWIDTTLISYETDLLTNVSIQHPNTRVSLSKKDGKWVLETDGKEVNSEKWDPIVQKIAHLIANKYVGNEEVKNYPTISSHTLDVSAGNESETLTFSKGKNDYLVTRKSDSAHFIIGNEKAEEFKLTSSDLM